MKKLCYFYIIINIFWIVPGLLAQFNRDDYFDYLPCYTEIICQTKASAGLHLYGNKDDSNYHDLDPVDGIDDQRAKRLQYLAAIFSPILRKNNFSKPRDFEDIFSIPGSGRENIAGFNNHAFLHVDTWDLTQPESQQEESYSINLGILSQTPGENSNDGTPAYREFRKNDSLLTDLICKFRPDTPRVQKIDPDHHLQRVLLFDFPGCGEKSWKKIYKNLEKKSRIYAHFFIHQDSTPSEPACYELVVQYWFFYPFNDGGNNHEGDWEHINVRITTREHSRESLTLPDIARILDHNNQTILDSLVIGKIDYYFHHFVTTLDYQIMDFLSNRKDFDNTLENTQEQKVLQSWIYQQMYHRLHLVKETLNNHPIGYIGADNMGLDQIFTSIGGKNRNSHGTYPFPGVWKRIGPIGATEKINGEKKYQFLLPVLPSIDKETRKIILENPDYEAKENPNFITYSNEDIVLVPDWERVVELALKHPTVRRRWFWLILPIRWGFPVVKSPGAGVIKNTDMGNIAPVGPAYNSGWNRVGASRGYAEYDPHVLPSQFHLGLQDNFRNNWGFLNLTWPTFISLPTTNLIWSLTGARFEFNYKFFPKREVPFRFASIVIRPTFSIGDHDFARLLLADSVAINKYIRKSDAIKDNSSFKHENYVSLLNFMLNIHLGRYASENAFSISRSKVEYCIKNPTANSASPVKVQGDLKMMQLTGSCQFCFCKDNFQPFLRAGYGWTWYRLENLRCNSTLLEPSRSKWFHNPSFPYIIPNSWHAGIGLELFFQRNTGINQVPVLNWFFLGKPEAGIRLEYTFHLHRLGKDAPVNPYITRHEVSAGLVVGF